MISVAYTFVAKTCLWQSAPYPNIEEVRAIAAGKLQEGHLGVDIMLLIGGSEYLVDQVLSDPCHKITYYAITKSCEGVGEDSYEGTFAGAMEWAARKIQKARTMAVEVYLRVAGKEHLIDTLESK
jgi:hypothetical protein